MGDKVVDQIIERLKSAQPDAVVTSVRHELSADDFLLQKNKHLSHGARGGVVGILLTPENKIVLAHRSGMHAGWSLPGGTVEAGEDFEVAFKREIAEEVGVAVASPRLVMIEKKKFVSPAKEELDFVLAVYVARIKETVLPEPTDEAVVEGLKIVLFDLSALPQDMIFGDKKKVELYAA